MLFSDPALATIKAAVRADPAEAAALESLRHVVDLINQTVGDAISDLLLVEVILARCSFSVCQK